MRCRQEGLRNYVVYKTHKWLIAPGHIEKACRFFKLSELVQCLNLHELLECTDATRQGHEGTRKLHHAMLALFQRRQELVMRETFMQMSLVSVVT